MKTCCLALLFGFFFASSYSQLSGFAYLSGQSNHSGIKIKFIAASPTAVSDSVLTNANGSYSLNIAGGVYSIIFAKNSYQTIYYNNNTSVALTNSVVVTTQTLVPGNLQIVSGDVSGTWFGNTQYVVTGNCTVQQGSTLTVQPGTIIRFNGNYSLTVKGKLNAVGNASNKILFTSDLNNPQTGDWKGIYPQNGTTIIKNCIVEYAFIGLNSAAGSHTIENCEFRNSTFGIYIYNTTNSLIKNNLIWNMQDSYFSAGITLEGTNSTLVECNTLHTISGVGIRAWSGVNVKNNHVYNITKAPGTNYGWGIWSDYYASGRIENNYIHHCISGVSLGDSPNAGTLTINPKIINNVITNNTTGILYHAEAYGEIANNIVADNQVGIKNHTWATANSIVNNIFWNNSTSDFNNVSLAGLGQITNSNSAGYAVDSYYNLFQDPLLVSGTSFYSSSSPCINSGKTQYSSNIGNNSTTFCQGMIMGLTTLEDSKARIQAFPNPFSDNLTINDLSVWEITGLLVYDITGKSQSIQYTVLSENTILVNTHDLDTGLYFLKIEQKSKASEKIKVLKE